MSPDLAAVLIRAAGFLACLQSAGVVLFLAIFGERLEHAGAAVRRLGVRSACAAAVLISLHYGLEAARMGGDWASSLDAELQRWVLHTSLSSAWLLRIASLMLIALALWRAGTATLLLGLLGTVLMALSFTLVGHTMTAPLGLAVLLVVHLLAIAFWFGSLQPLRLIVRVEPLHAAAGILAAFSRWAVWIVASLFVAGALLLAELLPSWSQLWSPYGLLVCAKVAGFALLLGLAALNKWRYAPVLASRPAASEALRRTVLAEYVLICGVLLLTAVLTSFFSPESD